MRQEITDEGFFTYSDPIGEYRWRDVDGQTGGAADAIWAYGGPGARLSSQVLVPHWKVCLAIRRRWDEGRGHLDDSRLLLLGPVASARINADPPGSEIVAIRLQPEHVESLLSVAVADLIDIELEPPRSRSFDALLRLAEGAANQSIVGGAMLDWARALPVPRISLPHLTARLIRASGGRLPLRRLAPLLEASERSLRRQFLDGLGISPKRYARSVRLQSFLLDADRRASPDWADLALAHGYSDQSHMSNDVKALTNLTAVQLHAMRQRA